MSMTGGVLVIGGVTASLFVTEAFTGDSLWNRSLHGLFIVLLSSSFIWSGSAFRLFMKCYLGEKDVDTELEAGWSAKTITLASQEGDNLTSILASTIDGFERWVEMNQAH